MKKNTRMKVVATVLFKVFVIIKMFYSNKLDKIILTGDFIITLTPKQF